MFHIKGHESRVGSHESTRIEIVSSVIEHGTHSSLHERRSQDRAAACAGLGEQMYDEAIALGERMFPRGAAATDKAMNSYHNGCK